IERDVMLDDKVPSYALRHVLRVCDSGGTAARREALNLHDGAALVLHLVCKLVESFLRLRAQYLLSGSEANLGVRDRLILIQSADRLLHGVQTRACLIDGLLRCLRAVAGIDSVLVGLIGLERSLADTFLRASIDVLDVLRVLRSKLVALVHAVANRGHLALNVFLAGERIQVSPEPFVRVLLQRLMRGKIDVVVCVGAIRLRLCGRGDGLRSRRCLLVCAAVGFLGESRNHQSCSQRQRKQVTELHLFNSSKNVPEPVLGEGPGSLRGRSASSIATAPLMIANRSRQAAFPLTWGYINSSAILDLTGRSASPLV